MTKTDKNGKEYAPQIAFWPSKKDESKFTVFLDENVMATLAKAEEGGRLLLTEVSEEIRAKSPKAPRWRLTFFAKSEENSL